MDGRRPARQWGISLKVDGGPAPMRGSGRVIRDEIRMVVEARALKTDWTGLRRPLVHQKNMDEIRSHLKAPEREVR